MDASEKIAVPLLIVQTTAVVFLWSLDTLGQVSQKIFTLFLAADLLSFALMAHVYRTGKTRPVRISAPIMIWALAIVAFFVAGLIVP
ncbi:MAG: hypothetical protein OK455_00225 [Thaumarchaeota archaeon]|nr:hypothetical protein [Nitrososphaerota archaeon]